MKKRPEKRLTKGPSQMGIVTLAVHLLGGAERAIDTEDIAVRAHQLAPGRFSWKKYPDQINMELIRTYLKDAKFKGAFVLGSGRTGWRLTQKGLKWAQQMARKIGQVDTSRSRAELRSGSIDEQRWRRERSRLISTDAWTTWSSGNRAISVAQAKEVFRIDSYATGDLREAKITRLRSLFTEDSEVAPFLDYLITVVLNNEAEQ
jgi:hypothetical protein